MAADILTADEMETLTALVDCLIPADPPGPSASQAGVVEFIERQLSGPYGAGRGTFVGRVDGGHPGARENVSLPPLDRYRAGLAELDARASAAAGYRFAALRPEDRVCLLRVVERDPDAGSIAGSFFRLVLENTMEGYFADPVHGGNRAAAGWRMVGFPGCGHDYRQYVGKNVDVAGIVPVQSIATWRERADADPSQG